jgi:hypothetical protein
MSRRAAAKRGLYGEAGRGAVAQWSQPAGTLHVEVLELVREQRPHRVIVILSNATDRLGDDLRRLACTTRSTSCSTALPSGMPSPINVIAANEVGFVGHHFTTVDGLRAFLSGR